MPIVVAALIDSGKLLNLSGVDIAIIAMNFVTVLGIGFYLKRFTKTGADFFLAGGDMRSPPANPPVLYNLHASVWWGAVLFILGLIYFVRFFPKRP
jgi:hypothetical protein